VREGGGFWGGAGAGWCRFRPMKVVSLPELHVVGVLVQGDWGTLSARVPETIRGLTARVGGIAGRIGEGLTEVCLGHEGKILRELVGVEVAPGTVAPAGLELRSVPARTALHLRYEGDASGVAGCFERMYAWLATNGLATDDCLIDRGACEEGSGVHDLYVTITGEGRPPVG
jgi:GyrI-like small molecule binding protein